MDIHLEVDYEGIHLSWDETTIEPEFVFITYALNFFRDILILVSQTLERWEMEVITSRQVVIVCGKLLTTIDSIKWKSR